MFKKNAINFFRFFFFLCFCILEKSSKIRSIMVKDIKCNYYYYTNYMRKNWDMETIYLLKQHKGNNQS